MTKKDILDFIKKQKHAVIATSDKRGKPEAALVGFGETDKLELVFGTYNTTKKYKNLKENNRVAFVIGWDEDFITVQYEGIAEELTLPMLEEYVSLYHKKTPEAIVYKFHPGQTYFKVTPTWIRYSDLSTDEEKIFEFTFPQIKSIQ